MGVKRAAAEIATFNFDRRYFAETVVHAQDELFGIRFFVDINLTEFDAALTQELFGAAAVAAPVRSINDDI